MKRSEINRIIENARNFTEEYRFRLPPFAHWTYEEWKTKSREYQEIQDNMLGWDITDFGSGDYNKIGLLMFTIRNGNLSNKRYAKPYAEKILISLEGQVTPYHFHWNKMEDIINRGGGNLILKCYNSDAQGNMLDTTVTIYSDGREYAVQAGTEIVLTNGESITLPTGQYHTFWAEGGPVLIGEVSKVNDDNVDNRFYEPVGRFPAIEEDEPILYPLFNEYPEFV